MSIEVVECDAVTDEVVDAFERLTPQLSSSNPAPAREQLDEIVRSRATVLFLARDDRQIVGSLTLALFRIPTGLRAWIEDVVVDDAARGKGAGEALSRAAIARAKAAGAVSVDLTSRPSREAANRLYQRIGFERRETNVYRYDLTK
jgi:ribosomal protein S18 acetylase RimI-like enzyme